jgi:hypothetical protein
MLKRINTNTRRNGRLKSRISLAGSPTNGRPFKLLPGRYSLTRLTPLLERYKGHLTKGQVRDFQIINSMTGHYIKRSASTGRLTIKADGEPFKGVSLRKTPFQAAPNPAIDEETAKWAEEAVIDYLNEHPPLAK